MPLAVPLLVKVLKILSCVNYSANSSDNEFSKLPNKIVWSS
jgi:hypothetical protein